MLVVIGASHVSALLKSRRLRKRAIFRWSLVVVPLAFLAAQIRPVEGISTPVLVIVISVVAILPMIVVHWYLSRRQNRRRKTRDTQAFLAAAPRRTDVPADAVNKHARSEDLSDGDAFANTALATATAAEAGADSSVYMSAGIDDLDAEAGADGNLDLDATICTPEQLQVQVERVGDVVGTHDLGELHSERAYEAESIAEDRSRQDQLSEAGTSLITATSYADTAQLSELNRTEITQLVTTLQKDKIRLHRLVIAQQSSLDTERKAHDRSRIVARDAIKIMRDSREAQKQAEKMARRERHERLRIEQEYEKVSSALDNAMSIIKSRQNETA